MIKKVVRPASTRWIACWILSSVALSMALVESSRIRMRVGEQAQSPAAAYPPSVLQLTDHGVVAVLEAQDEVVRLGVLRRLDDGFLSEAVAQPKGDIFADQREKKTSCSMVEICERSDARLQPSTPSITMRPASTS